MGLNLANKSWFQVWPLVGLFKIPLVLFSIFISTNKFLAYGLLQGEAKQMR